MRVAPYDIDLQPRGLSFTLRVCIYLNIRVHPSLRAYRITRQRKKKNIYISPLWLVVACLLARATYHQVVDFLLFFSRREEGRKDDTNFKDFSTRQCLLRANEGWNRICSFLRFFFLSLNCRAMVGLKMLFGSHFDGGEKCYFRWSIVSFSFDNFTYLICIACVKVEAPIFLSESN